MAPEQADGLRPGPAADVYSLALTLYECLCGEHPLLREGPAATARAIGEPIAPLAAVRPELPEQMTETIDAALDPDPEERPLASELGAVLAAHVAELDGEPLPPIAGIDGDAFLEPRRRPGPRPLPSRRRRRRTRPRGPDRDRGAGADRRWPRWHRARSPLGRPRPAYALQLALVLLWLVIGAGEPGVAAMVAVLGRSAASGRDRSGGDRPAGPRADPRPRRTRARSIRPSPGSPAAPPGAPCSAGIGYLWLAAWEELAHRTLLLGPVADPPAHWTGSAGTALSDVVAPLVDGSVLAGAGSLRARRLGAARC